MKTPFLLISMLLLSACSGCRTTGETKEKPNMSNSYAAKTEMLLQKIVGGFDGEERKDDQYFECKVMSDITETAEVKNWIADLPRTTITGMHIMARSPSIQIYAYEGEQQIVILKDWSQIVQPDAQKPEERNAITELSKIVEKYCPTPSKTN